MTKSEIDYVWRIIKIKMIVQHLLWFIIYIGAVFIKWELFNPFQWILDIPQLSKGDRINYLCMWFTWNFLWFLFLIFFYKPKPQNKK